MVKNIVACTVKSFPFNKTTGFESQQKIQSGRVKAKSRQRNID